MPDMEMAFSLSHTERNEVKRIQLVLRIEVEGEDVMNLKMKSS